jgi:signal transduction histidine kinase
MSSLASPFVSLTVFGSVLALLIGRLTWRQRPTAGAKSYALLMAILAVWTPLYALQLLSPDLAGKELWVTIRHAAIPLIVIAFWDFTANYTARRDLLGARYLVPILLVGGALSASVVANPGGLYFAGTSLYTGGASPRVAISYGPLFWVMVGYIVAVVGGGHVYIVDLTLKTFDTPRSQMTMLAVGGVFEFALLSLYLTEHVQFVRPLNPWPHVELVVFGIVLLAIPIGWSFFNQAYFELEPLAQKTVIENFDDAVFVFDRNGHRIYLNAAARQLVPAATAGTDDPLPAEKLFADRPSLLERYREATARGDATDTGTEPDDDTGTDAVANAGTDGETRSGTDGGTRSGTDGGPVQGPTGETDTAQNGEPIAIETGAEERFYDIEHSLIRNQLGEQIGTVLVARDVTESHRRWEELQEQKAQLERQNDRLDDFASIVAHDLRNPLNVAAGRLKLAREEQDSDNLEAVAGAHDQMERLIEDLLTLARQGRTVTETEWVSLGEMTDLCWETVATRNGALVSGTDLEVRADRARLRQLLENLFRNAVEHGGDDVTVTVGRLPDGFFVADDGPGIPAEQRDSVFEDGYSTADDGTGFGLSIVTSIVEAHGWEITVTGSDSGGARFEITGVDTR